MIDVQDINLGAVDFAGVSAGEEDGDVLAYHRAARAHTDALGPSRMSRGTHLLLWGLRAYVVFMAVVVVMQVAQTWHG